MYCAGSNFADVCRRNGNENIGGTAPWLFGCEGAGVIEQAAAAVRNCHSAQGLVFAEIPHVNAAPVSVDMDKLIAAGRKQFGHRRSDSAARPDGAVSGQDSCREAR